MPAIRKTKCLHLEKLLKGNGVVPSMLTRSRVKLLTDEQRIERIKENIELMPNKPTYLLKSNVVNWCFPNSRFSLRITAQREKSWGQSILGYETNQWTTKLGESILEETLRCLGKNPRRIQKRQKGESGKELVPDFETDDALYECKARTYTTTGTAGEKILGTPWKYSNCYELYKKPLYIVCMAYQEKEAQEDFCLFDTKLETRKKMIECYEKEAKIRYIKFTDLLKQLI